MPLLWSPCYYTLLFSPEQMLSQLFSYIQNPFNMAAPFIWPDFCGLLVTGLIGFHCTEISCSPRVNLVITHYPCIVLYHRVLCGLILFLCLVGTLVDIAVSFAKSHSSPVNKSDGFMPIRDVSIATDHDQTPNGQSPFAKIISDSDHGPLLPSTPAGNFSTRTTLPSFHQEPAKPSKFARRLCVLHNLLKMDMC